MKRILIAVPTNKYVETETMKSIYDLIIPEGFETELQFFYGYQIDQVRNLIADWGKRYDYVLHVDSDIILPNDALVKMLASNKLIISGLYIQRKPDTQILEVYQDSQNGGVENIPYWAIYNKGVIPIAACGFGCVLVNSDVYRTMEYPHFVYSSAINHNNTRSEDIYFCSKARSKNIISYADTSIICNHVGSTHFSIKPIPHLEQIYNQDLLPKEHADYLKTITPPKIVYDIGACVLHWTRKAREAWPDASFYLLDAATSVEPFLVRSGYPYEIAVLSNSDCKAVQFYEDSQNPGGNSYYRETTGAFTEAHASTRRTITLDTIVSTNSWPAPDMLKLDIQGAELDVLAGAKHTLASTTDIILEAQHVDYNEGAPKVQEVVEYLDSIGFSLVSNFCRGGADGDYHFKRR